MELILGLLLGLCSWCGGALLLYGLNLLFQRRYRRGILTVLAGAMVCVFCYPLLILALVAELAEMFSVVAQQENASSMFSEDNLFAGIMFGLLAGIGLTGVAITRFKSRLNSQQVTQQELRRT